MIFDRVAEVSFSGVELNPVTDLRIRFTVEKGDHLKFYAGAITVFNLPKSTRSVLARPYPIGKSMIEPVITVTLRAGYRGQDVQLYSGDLLKATNERAGTDWQTVMEMFTGYNVASKALIVDSLTGTIPAKTVVDRLVAPLLISVRYTARADEVLRGQRVASYSVAALSFRATHDFLSRYGLAFMLEDDGQGLVYVDDEPRDPGAGKTEGNTFSRLNGLVGTPKITNEGVSIRSLLRPGMRIMQTFFVESETIRGTLGDGDSYYATNVTHTGDTRGEDWHTEVEGAYSNIADVDYQSLGGS